MGSKGSGSVDAVRSRLVSLLIGALLLPSCRLQIEADITVAEDGSGVVEVVVGLDADAIERIGGDLDGVLVTTDLVEAGWTVTGPTLDADGYTRVRARHEFTNPGEAAQRLAELTGPDGMFQGLRVERRNSLARTQWDFTGRLDFSGGLEAFSDPALAAQLDGEPLGRTVAEIEAQLGEPLREAIQVRVAVALPGEVTADGAETVGDRVVWQAQFGDPAVALEAHGEEWRSGTLVAGGGAAGTAVLLLGYGLWRLVRRGRRPPAT